MADLESKLKEALTSRDAEAPPFADTFGAATRRVEHRSQWVRVGVPVAAAIALVAVMVGRPDPVLVTVSDAELLGATSWRAPSDELLPTHRFDIYRDLPDLIESTKVDGETL